MVLISDLDRRSQFNYLKVDLVGFRSNRDGLGARVEVTAGGRTYTKVHDGVSGYLSHSVIPLYFGLGTSSSIEKVVVRWPSGTVQTLTEDLQPNRTLTITETAPKAAE